MKPLAKKLQNRKQYIYAVYHMVDKVIDQLKSFRDNIDTEFTRYEAWVKKVGVDPSTLSAFEFAHY